MRARQLRERTEGSLRRLLVLLLEAGRVSRFEGESSCRLGCQRGAEMGVLSLEEVERKVEREQVQQSRRVWVEGWVEVEVEEGIVEG
jgi:hypothetical protein